MGNGSNHLVPQGIGRAYLLRSYTLGVIAASHGGQSTPRVGWRVRQDVSNHLVPLNRVRSDTSYNISRAIDRLSSGTRQLLHRTQRFFTGSVLREECFQLAGLGSPEP